MNIFSFRTIADGRVCQGLHEALGTSPAEIRVAFSKLAYDPVHASEMDIAAAPICYLVCNLTSQVSTQTSI